ncbi:MAG TPA: hypothetical protein VML75_10450 [Kofleriaceae bacterium]|nr:hypothetical protein [Kofleriaceae bacterium]
MRGSHSRTRPRGWLLFGIIAALAAVMALALLIGPRGRADDAAPGRPEPVGVLATGGTPTRDDPGLDALFTEALPDWLVALNHPSKDPDELSRRRDAVTAASAGRPFGAALNRMLDAASAAMRARETEAERAADELATAAEALNDVLMASGLPYQVEPDVTESDAGRRVILFSFAIEHVAVYRSGAHTLRVLTLHRLDRLNWSFTLLGFTSARRREALILAAQVEERLVDRLLPLLSSPPPRLYRIDGAESEPWGDTIEALAANAIRRELGTTPALKRLGTLLARRRALFDAWDASLADRGIALASPEALRLPDSVPSELEGYVPGVELSELRAIEMELANPSITGAFATARSRLIDSIALHELQHRLDNLHGDLPHPPQLAQMVGPLRDRDGRPRRFATRAGAELSAYLGAMARDQALPQTSLAILLQFLLEETYWDTPEGYAALVVFEELTRMLATEAAAPLVRDGTVDRAAAAAAYRALARHSSATLRDSARSLWQRLFERPLDPIEPAR